MTAIKTALNEKSYQIYIESESQISIIWDAQIDVGLNQNIHLLADKLRQDQDLYIREIVVAYHIMSIYIDSWQFSIMRLRELLDMKLKSYDPILERTEGVEGKLIKIPVCYDGTYGIDLEALVQHTGLSIEEVIQRHTAPEYYVYMIGFLPGFPYLGGLDLKLQMPRKEVPRKTIFEGAVGIAGGQTGIYPLKSPGGWQIIGRTPLKLFNDNSSRPTLVRAGDHIKFISIDLETYGDIERGIKTWDIYA